MTSEESLELISRMLRNAQERFVRGMGTPFIFFGYLTAAMSLAVWCLLKTTGDFYWNYLWFAIPVAAVIWGLFHLATKPKPVTTFFDRAVGQVWMIMGACCSLVPLYVILFDKYFPVLMVVSLMMFAGEAITGGILRLRYVQIMGIIGILLSFVIPFIGGIDQIFVLMVISLLVMVIPGHIMNAQAWQAIQRDSHV